MEIAENDGKLTETLLHVDSRLAEYGFKIGHVKLRNFELISPGEVRIESRVHNVNGFTGELNSWYDKGTATLSRDELLWRQSQYEDRNGGEWQRWKRIDEDSEHGVNLLRGLAVVATQHAEWETALAKYEKALKRERSAENLNNVAWWLAVVPDRDLRDPSRAVTLGEEACKATNFQSASYLDTLASAYAADGQWENAVRYQIQACKQLETLDREYFMRLAWFRESTPFVHGMSRDVDVDDLLAGLKNQAVGAPE